MTRFDAAMAARDEEMHRAHFGHCLGPCDHEECRTERETDDTYDLGDPVA